MEIDNKYDETFKRSELGEDEVMEREHEQYEKDLDEHITREPKEFGGDNSYL